MKTEEYLSELTAHLQRRGVSDQRIGDIVAEVENHLADSHETALTAFGSADEYAENMATQEENTADPGVQSQHHLRTFRATAFDEMDILAVAGNEGWELMSVGAWALFCRRPRDHSHIDRWEYKRRTGHNRDAIRKAMALERWEPCGNWLPFNYFKRRIS